MAFLLQKGGVLLLQQLQFIDMTTPVDVTGVRGGGGDG